MSIDAKRYLTVGKFGRVHGIKGFIFLYSYTDPPDNIFQYPKHFILSKHMVEPITFETHMPYQEHWLVKLKDITNRETLKNYTNLLIVVDKNLLEATEHFYLADLEGMQVFDEKSELIGTVSGSFRTSAHDILIVQSLKKEYLIPFVPDLYIKQIDKEKKVIIIDRICIDY